MRKNITEKVDFRLKINRNGNWNYRGIGEETHSKNIANFFIGDDMFCLTHNELLILIKMHIKADEFNILMINSQYVDTGIIEHPETTLKNKIKGII